MAVFHTRSIAVVQAALYTLTIFAPASTGASANSIMSFTFPLSPQHVTRETVSLTTFYDVPSLVLAGGVQRIVDDYGRAPPIYNIRGTTGWKSHSTDLYLSTGLTAMKRVDAMITRFHTLNQGVLKQGTQKFYTMEFYDFFTGSYWQVVPFGAQRLDQDAKQPLMQFYDFRLACIKKVADPLPDLLVDALATFVGIGAVSGLLRASSALSGIGSVMSRASGAISGEVTTTLSGLNSIAAPVVNAASSVF